MTPPSRLPEGSRTAPLRLAFIDPGLRKAPFFLALRNWLAPEVHCLYWSQRPVVRSYMRSARVSMFPADTARKAPESAVDDAELLRAIGGKELALRRHKALRRARGLMGLLAEFLDRERVDAILLWNGSNLRGALARHLARQRGIVVIHAEHGYLPGTTQIDLEGVNFDASISRLARSGAAQLPQDPALDAALDADIARFRTGQRMRDLDPLPPDELRRNRWARLASRVGFWMERRALPWVNARSVPTAKPADLPSRYVLLPFQVRSDSQLVLHSPLYGNDLESVVAELDAALAQIDPQLRLVAKFHPYELPQAQFAYRGMPRRHPRVCFISGVPMARLIEQACAVVTINSTAGFEAMLCDKPVLALGRNFYTVPGIVDCLERREDLPTALRTLLERQPDLARRRAFLRFAKANFLVDGGYHDFSPRSLRAFAQRVGDLTLTASRVHNRQPSASGIPTPTSVGTPASAIQAG